MVAAEAPPIDLRRLRELETDLREEYDRNVTRLATLNDRQGEIMAELQRVATLIAEAVEAAAAEEAAAGSGVRAIGQQVGGLAVEPREPVRAATGLAIPTADRYAATLGTFTLPEIAARVGVEPASLRKWMRSRVADEMLAATTKVFGAQVYEWRGPEAPEAPEDEPEPVDAPVPAAADPVDASLVEEAPPAADVEHPENVVRAYVTRTNGDYFSAGEVVDATKLDAGVVDKALGALARYGVIRPAGVDGMDLYEMVLGETPVVARTGPGPKPGDLAPKRGVPVAGTSKREAISNPEVRALVAQIESLGGVVNHASGGHFEVVYQTRRCLISSTPSHARSVLNDKSRVRRQLGLPLV